MKTIAIIPARAGSKRIKSKNIKLLGEKPLIQYTIETALKSKYIDKVIVSTNIESLKDLIESYGNNKLEFNWRSEVLCGDLVSTEEVLNSIIDEHDEKTLEAVVTLLPTSPFKTVDVLDECIETFFDNKADSVLTVSQEKLKIGEYNENSKTFNLYNKNTPAHMHKLKLTTFDNPAVYVTKPKVLQEDNFILGEKTFGVLIDKLSGLDINDDIDWTVAEVLIEKGLVNV